MNTTALNVAEFIDTRPVGAFHARVIALCGLVSALEGFDAQSLGYVAPLLNAQWHLAAGALAPAFSSALLGLMIGALFIAPLADRYGRRPVLIASTVIFGLSTVATVGAGGLPSLTLLRLITGLGLGGAMPNALALTAEYMPSRRRALLVTVMVNGFNLGSMLGGVVSAQFVDTLGWRAAFLVGGVLPLIVAPLLYYGLPESLSFLCLTDGPRASIVRTLRSMHAELELELDARIELPSHCPPGRYAFLQLFRAGRGLATVLLWIVFFMSLLDIYLLVSWLPTALTSGGAPLRTAIMAGICLQFGSIVGSIPLGWALDRYGARVAMVPAYLLAAVCIGAIGFATDIPLTLVMVFGAGFGLIGGQAAANALAAITYPTEIRSTGVGWALGMGRIGSIIGPVIGGGLLAAHASLRSIFLVSSIPTILAASAVLCLGLLLERRGLAASMSSNRVSGAGVGITTVE